MKVRYEALADDLLFFPATIDRDLTTRWGAQGTTVTAPRSRATEAQST